MSTLQYDRTEFDNYIDKLIETLRDANPNRGNYFNLIQRIGIEAVLNEAVKIGSKSDLRNPAAVFFAWAKKQPNRPTDSPASKNGEVQYGQTYLDPKSGDVILIDIDPDADPLAGFDEAVARL